MFIRFTALVAIVALLALPGCALKNPLPEGGSTVTVTETADGQKITVYNGNAYTSAAINEAQRFCIEYHQAKDLAELDQMSKLQNEIYRAWVITHQQTMRMISNVWGKEECSPGTNEFDAYIAYAEQQGAITRTWINVGGSVLKTGLIAGFTWAGVDSIMSAVGSSSSVGVQVTGDGNRLKDSGNALKAGRDASSVTGYGTLDKVDYNIDQNQLSANQTGDNNAQPPPLEEVQEVEEVVEPDNINIGELQVVE